MTTDPSASPRPSPRPVVTFALLALGAVLLIAFGRPVLYWRRQLIFAAIALLLTAIPAIRKFVMRLMARCDAPSVRTRCWTAIVISVAASIYLFATAVYQERDFFPRFHDEQSYMLQIQFLSHGKLWTSQHPLADFFETTHVLVKPVYAPIFFPGCALMNVPGAWLGLPYWVLPIAFSGCAVGLLYRVVTELAGGVAGILAAILLAALPIFRQISLMVMSHTCMLLLGLALIWAWLHWRRSRRWYWLVAMGVFSGWAAITRPIDSIAWVTPVMIATLYDMRGDGLRRIVTQLIVIAVAAMPFISLQLVFDVGVTGKLLHSPYGMYLDQFSPQSLWGVGGRLIAKPQTTLQEKLDYHQQFTVTAMRENPLSRMPQIWLKERFPDFARVTLASTLLLMLLPLGIAALSRSAGRIVLATVPALYILLFGSFAYLLLHYIVVNSPGVILLAVLGRDRLAATWPTNRFLACGSVLCVIALALTSFAELNWYVRDDLFIRPVMYFNYVELPKVVKGPAIVLYRYRTGDNPHEEPVYNLDVVNPDDAPIIRAHDFGPKRDKELFDYYAKRQPDRTVYLFDRASRTLTKLGNVAALARAIDASTTKPASQP